MSETTGTVETGTRVSFTADAKELRAVLGNAVNYCSTDKTRSEVLGAVLVLVDGTGVLTTVSTDSYALLRQDFTMETAPGTAPGETVPAPVEVLVNLAGAVKVLPRTGAVRVIVSAEGVVISGENVASTFPAVPGEFPKWEKLFPDYGDTVPATTVSLGGAVSFARLGKVTAPSGERNVTFTMRAGDTVSRPVLVTAHETRWEFRAIHMPVRVS